jgi:HipA-like kinase
MKVDPFAPFDVASRRPPGRNGRAAPCHNGAVPDLRTVRVTRYVTPLREGGSLPAIVEADDDGMYVLKFRGAGQGTRALVAELVAGELARALGLPVPELVFAELAPELARTEPDPEIHSLIFDSAGLNLALDYLPGSVTFDPAVQSLDEELASRIVWFDAFMTNVDRTARNTNMLMWHRKPWLIDHGATLYFHHTPGWESDASRPVAPFPLIRQHVLLPRASRVREVDAGCAAALSEAAIAAVTDQLPDDWLEGYGLPPPSVRQAYVRYLVTRLAPPRAFVEEAAGAR